MKGFQGKLIFAFIKQPDIYLVNNGALLPYDKCIYLDIFVTHKQYSFDSMNK